MNNEQIKQLEKELWDAADALRANSKLTAGEYKDPILGLVFLRFAQNLYEQKKIFNNWHKLWVREISCKSI